MSFPAHLYLNLYLVSSYYIFRDHSVNFTVYLRKKECLSIEFIGLIPQKLTISTHQYYSPPLLIKSLQNAGFYVERHCFQWRNNSTPYISLYLLVMIALWRSHIPVRITKSPITGKSFVTSLSEFVSSPSSFIHPFFNSLWNEKELELETLSFLLDLLVVLETELKITDVFPSWGCSSHRVAFCHDVQSASSIVWLYLFLLTAFQYGVLPVITSMFLKLKFF